MWESREPRFNSNLIVSIVGRDVNGNRFTQTATVENISRRGGRLAEVRCLRGPGDVIQIEHRGKKAQFRVVWIDVASGHVGLCCTDDSCLWKAKLPDWALRTTSSAPVSQSPQTRTDSCSSLAEPSPAISSRARVERRFPRYRCMGGVAANLRGLQLKVWGRLTVIGMGGCYVETVSPFALGTRLELLIGAHGIDLRLPGEVRYMHPRVGMGVMFTELDQKHAAQLERIVTAASGR